MFSKAEKSPANREQYLLGVFHIIYCNAADRSDAPQFVSFPKLFGGFDVYRIVKIT